MSYMKNLYEDIWEMHMSDKNMSNARIAEYLDCPMDWVDSVLSEREIQETIDEVSKLIADETLQDT
jgi:hypothetical protein